MRKGIVENVKAVDRQRLAAIVANRNSRRSMFGAPGSFRSRRTVWALPRFMRQTGKSKSVVWRWQERFMQAGVDGRNARAGRRAGAGDNNTRPPFERMHQQSTKRPTNA
jgi:hypothetical protein